MRSAAPTSVGRAEAADRFGFFAEWAALNRQGLTIFAHAETGADHTAHVVWFSPSEALDLSIFR